MIKHKEQRVGILVDAANMYHSAKNLFGRRVNFKNILDEAVAGRKLIRATAYVIRSESEEEAGFFEALNHSGFEVKIKDLQVFSGGAKKADWDIGIAIDAIKLANRLDVIVLVSGDGDFLPLLSYLQNNKGCLVELMAFRKTCSAQLIEEADGFIDLGLDDFFLIKNGKGNKDKKTK